MKARLIVVLMVAAASAVSAARGATLDAASFAYRERPGSELPRGSSFLDSEGRRTSLGALTGGVPMVLVPGYYHCSNLCGLVRASLLTAIRRAKLMAGRDYVLAVLSIDPSETPDDARQAKAQDTAAFALPGAERYWHYLTAAPVDIKAVTDAVGFPDQFDGQSNQFIHPAGIVFTTRDGVVSNYLLGVGYRPADVRAAVERASGGNIARVAEPLLLICFHFDSATGRYSLEVMKVLRLAAVLTMLCLGGVVFLVRGKPNPP